MVDKKVQRIQSIDRALDIVEYLFNSEGEVSISQISRDLKESKATVYRCLSTLQNRGYVRQNSGNEMYSLGTKLYMMGNLRTDLQARISIISQQYLTELSKTLGETSFITSLQSGRDGLYKSMVMSRVNYESGLMVSLKVGEMLPAHESASGICMLAFGDHLKFHNKADDRLSAYIEAEGIDERILKDQMGESKKNGYCYYEGCKGIGTASLAFPIMFGERAVACLGIVGPTERIRMGGLEEKLKVIKSLSLELSEMHNASMEDRIKNN